MAEFKLLRYLLLLIALSVLFNGVPALGAENCATCHKYDALTAEGKELGVHGEGFRGTAHEGLYCSDCHKGCSDYPHNAPNVRCDLPCHVEGGGHAGIMERIEAGPHKNAGGESKPPCIACHPAPTPAPGKGSGAQKVCEGCHPGKGELEFSGLNSPGALGRRGHGSLGDKAPACGDCHGSHELKPVEASSCESTSCHQSVPKGFASLYDHGAGSATGVWDYLGRAIILFVGLFLLAHLVKG